MTTKKTRSTTPKRPSMKAAFTMWISFSFLGWLAIMGLASLLFPNDSLYFADDDHEVIDIAPAYGPDLPVPPD